MCNVNCPLSLKCKQNCPLSLKCKQKCPLSLKCVIPPVFALVYTKANPDNLIDSRYTIQRYTVLKHTYSPLRF